MAPSRRATTSCIAECPEFRSRSSSPPRHRGTMSSRMPSVAATRSVVRKLYEARWPCSIRQTVEGDVPASRATSAWRNPRRLRTARIAAPTRCSTRQSCQRRLHRHATGASRARHWRFTSAHQGSTRRVEPGRAPAPGVGDAGGRRVQSHPSDRGWDSPACRGISVADDRRRARPLPVERWTQAERDESPGDGHGGERDTG